MADPVSWFLIERGWQVVDSAGEEVGTVDEVTGDENADIFDGLSISGGFFSEPRYVPSERVAQITDGQVALRLSRAEVEALPAFQEPPASLELSSEKASLTDRAAAPFVDERETPAPTSSWRRLVDRLLGR
jgi:hypothetical protein